MKFHHIERKTDMVRRRRWHRKMVNTQAGAPCFFSMQEQQVSEVYLVGEFLGALVDGR